MPLFSCRGKECPFFSARHFIAVEKLRSVKVELHPLKDPLKSLPSLPQNVTLGENSAVADISSLNEAPMEGLVLHQS